MRNLAFVAVLAALGAPALALPVIDGVISPHEWDGANNIPMAGGIGTVSVYADTDYLYALFNVADSTDARLGQDPVGNDAIGLNINPTSGGPWGKPYDIIFQTGADPAAWGGVDSGMIDGWHTGWTVTGVQEPLPGEVLVKTIFSGGMSVTEWRIPLSTIGPAVGDTLLIGGSDDADGVSHVYPVGLDWSNPESFIGIGVNPAPVAVPVPSALLLVGIGSGLVTWRRRRSAI